LGKIESYSDESRTDLEFPPAVSNLLNLAAARLLRLNWPIKLLFKKGLLIANSPAGISAKMNRRMEKAIFRNLEFKSYDNLQLSARLNDQSGASLKTSCNIAGKLN